MKAPENNSYTKCKLHFGVPSLPLEIFIQLSPLTYSTVTPTRRKNLKNQNLKESKFNYSRSPVKGFEIK